MGPQPSLPAKTFFGPFELDAVAGDLRKFGNRIRLQGKPMQILSLLVDRGGQVVSREELQQHLWRDTEFVDFEQGLNAAVNKLRQALGDSADQPLYVETVPGRGYRFVGPIRHDTPGPVLEMPAARSYPQPQSHGQQESNWRRWAAAAMILIAAGTAGYVLGAGRHSSGEAEAAAPKPVRFTIPAPPGFVFEGAASRQAFALSPDGSRLAFTAMDASGAFHIFLRDLGSLSPRLLPDSKGAHTLFWPPDGRSLYATINSKLRRLELDENRQTVVCDSPPFLLMGTWLEPGKLMLNSGRGSFTIPASGGVPQPQQETLRWGHLLPDGKHILYWESKDGKGRVRVAHKDGVEPAEDVVDADSRAMFAVAGGKQYLLFVRAGSLLAQPFDLQSRRVSGEGIPVVDKVYHFWSGAADFSVSNGTLAYLKYASRSQLVWVDRAGKLLGPTGPAGVNVKSGRLSPDGEKLAMAIYDVEAGAQNLWIADTRTNDARRLLLPPGGSDAAVWSPDAKRVAFLRGTGGVPPRIGMRGLESQDQEEAVVSGGFQMPTDWSPDGRFVAFSNTGSARFPNDTQGDVWLVDTARSRRMIPLLNTPFHEANAVFSPDGKWLAFTSNESGQAELYLQAFLAADEPRVTGPRYLVSRSGALAVRWRRDGKELFYLGFNGKVHAVPMQLSPKPVFGAAKELFTIGTDARGNLHSVPGFDVSADGQRFVIPVVSADAEGPVMVVVQNWEAGLRNRSAQ